MSPKDGVHLVGTLRLFQRSSRRIGLDTKTVHKFGSRCTLGWKFISNGDEPGENGGLLFGNTRVITYRLHGENALTYRIDFP